MLGYIARRVLLMVPTIFGILLISFIVVQFAPGGPVERIIAQLQGQDSGGSARLGGGSDVGSASLSQTAGGSEFSSKYRGSQGLDPKFVKELEKQFGFDKPVYERFWIMIRSYAVFDFGQSYFGHASVMQLIAEKLPVSISLGLWMTLLSYGISIPLGIAKAVRDGSRFDVWTSGVITIGYALPSFLFAVLLIILFAGGSFYDRLPAARPHVRQLGRSRHLSGQESTDYLWHITLPVAAMTIGCIRDRDLPDQELVPGRDPQAIRADSPHEGAERAPRALRPCVPQRHDDRRGRLSRARSSVPSSLARC